MEAFSTIIDYIARTNLFNFIIFLAIILFIAKKCDLSGKVEVMRADVENTIEESKTAKIESETHLHSVEESIANIESEIESIIKTSEENTKKIGSKIIDEAENTVKTIRENLEKSVENNRNLLKNELIRKASDASIEVAKSHIINELNNNPDLHNKLIDESIDAINKVNLG